MDNKPQLSVTSFLRLVQQPLTVSIASSIASSTEPGNSISKQIQGPSLRDPEPPRSSTSLGALLALCDAANQASCSQPLAMARKPVHDYHYRHHPDTHDTQLPHLYTKDTDN